jgi:putative DNA primase/helicase
LVGRFIILRLTKSFFGNEDPELFDRLLPEMPGILNLAIAGWRRLKQRGYFQQPASSDDVAEQFEDISSPVKQFVRERCILDPDHTVTRDAIFDAWYNWCKTEGREHQGTKATFGRDLSAAFPEIGEKRFGNGRPGSQERTRVYAGIKLRSQESWGYDERGFWLCVNGIKRRPLTWSIDLNDAPAQPSDENPL